MTPPTYMIDALASLLVDVAVKEAECQTNPRKSASSQAAGTEPVGAVSAKLATSQRSGESTQVKLPTKNLSDAS